MAVRRLLCDTFDGRLYRRGEVLEFGEQGGVPELVWRRLGGEVLRRLAAPAPGFAWDLPPGPFRRKLEEVAEVRALLPLVRVATRREALEVLDGRRKVVCRVFAEEHRAGAPEARNAGLLPLAPRVRVEPVRGYARAARLVGEALSRVPGLEPGARDLLEEALAALGRGPPAYSSKVGVALEPDLTAAEALRRVLLRLLEILEANQEGTRAQLDSEFLHDFRVAVRRTRSALGQAKAVLPPAALERFRAGFAWLGQITGPARDLDVHLLEFPAYQAALPAASRPHLEPLRAFLAARRRVEQRRLARALGSRRYEDLLRDWRAFLAAGSEPWVGDPDLAQAGRPVREVAARRLHKALGRTLREGRAIGDASPPEEFHELRKKCKKLRYLLEFFESLFPAAETGALIRALKGLQDNLGRYQDVHVQSAALAGFSREMEAAGSAAAGTHVALGMLLAQLGAREAALRREFAGRFAAFAADPAVPRFKELLRATPPTDPVLPAAGGEEDP